MKKCLIMSLLLIAILGCQQKEVATVKEETPVKKSESPKIKGCTKDAKMCPDGRTVGRNPENNCEFFACDSATERKKKKMNKQTMCPADAKQCPDGSWVGRDNYNNCNFKECPEDTSKKNGREEI